MDLKSPSILNDPRFSAGRALVQSGKVDEGAIDIFATLLEGARSTYGDSSVEAAACYYEYGNALFRSESRRVSEESSEEQNESQRIACGHGDQKLNSLGNDKKQPKDASNSVLKNEPKNEPEMDTKQQLPNKVITDSDSKVDPNQVSVQIVEHVAEAENDNDESDNGALALEMMENAFAIYDLNVNNEEGSEPSPYRDWMGHQIPRVLTGIGDVLEFQGKHGDAVDAFTRAIPYRERQLDSCKQLNTLTELKCQRLLTESFVLVCEALLRCPKDQDVRTTETGDVLVKANERADFVRGYYDKARDELQETVFLMAKIAASGTDMGTEKEDICFLSTMLMAVGQDLAELDEANAANMWQPPLKKSKKET